MMRPAVTVGGFVLALILLGSAGAAEVMPGKPAGYFNDYAKVVPPERAAALNAQLEQFERETSNQLVVAVFPKMQSDSSIEDYTVRIFQSWGVGQRAKDNGAVLFVFIADRKMRIEVGYGLEPVLTDAESARIIEAMKPAFRSNDFAAGLAVAVEAMMAATKGEYRGTGKTVSEQEGSSDTPWPIVVFMILAFVIPFVRALSRLRRGVVYDSRGRKRLPGHSGGWWMATGGGGGGGWSGSAGGGFSGGGGSSGGGGASGSW